MSEHKFGWNRQLPRRLFSVKIIFNEDGEVNQHNVWYWSQNNPLWMDFLNSKEDNILYVEIIYLGPFFFVDIAGGTWLIMLTVQFEWLDKHPRVVATEWRLFPLRHGDKKLAEWKFHLLSQMKYIC